uniref:Uncharacterized protein n=1 Tax=Romanomermis culicivorax TaxID=13658 RepID=A0A915JFR6_ROMCU
MHYQMDQLASATPHITNHTDQLASATPRIIDTTPQAKTRGKTTGLLTARRHLYLDDQPQPTCCIKPQQDKDEDALFRWTAVSCAEEFHPVS